MVALADQEAASLSTSGGWLELQRSRLAPIEDGAAQSHLAHSWEINGRCMRLFFPELL